MTHPAHWSFRLRSLLLLTCALVLSLASPARALTPEQVADCFAQCEGETLDTDGDGLSDCVELCLGTDPHNPDTDGDGMPDGWEVRHGLNPLDPADAAEDAAGNLDSNLQEFLQGSDPNDVDSPRRLFFVAQDGHDWPGRGRRDMPLRTIGYALQQIALEMVPPSEAGVVLEPGEYREDVHLLPGVLLRGSTSRCGLEQAASCATILGTVHGAEGALVKNLVLSPAQPDDVLLVMDDVVMWITGVLFLGDSSRQATGVRLHGHQESTMFFECVFSTLDIALDIHDSIPCVNNSDFMDCATTQILLRDTEHPGSNPIGLGDHTRTNYGWNRHLGGLDEMVLVNERDSTVLIQRNEWDTEDPAEIMMRMNKSDDFEPFLEIDQAFFAGSVFYSVWDAENEAPILNASVRMDVSPLRPVTENTNGLYAFPVVSEGGYTATVTAPGFQTRTLSVDLSPGEVKSMLAPMRRVGGPGPPGTGCACPEGARSLEGTGGNLLLGLLVGGFLLGGRRIWKV